MATRPLVRRSPRNQKINLPFESAKPISISAIITVGNNCLKHGINNCNLCDKDNDDEVTVQPKVSIIFVFKNALLTYLL